ncbi:rod shape-determining protein MreC [Patescibacteria group bacterium]|nr:rod shape-determining protein MreC [Patescibacteria group bacterium]
MTNTRALVLALGGAFLLLSVALGALTPAGALIRRVTLPFVRVSARAASGISERLPWFHQVSQANALELCESRLQRIVVDETALHTLSQENQVLRAEAKFSQSSGYDQVGALVISRELGSLRGRLLIDRGTRDHLEVGQAVITGEGVYIGHILSVQTQIATVILLTDSESRVAVATAGEDALIGVVEGRGNGAAALTYIPSSVNLNTDQIIVTAGTESKIPARLPLGIINAINRTPKDPFYNASVDPLVRFDRVTYVSVLRPEALRPGL